MHETNVSSRHLNIQIQSVLIVKKLLVATYGFCELVSGLGAKTLQVRQHPSKVSALKTVLDPVVSFNVYGIVHAIAFGQV